MIKYTACFVGRLIGSLGESYWINVEIEAENVDKATNKLYETHEHITRLFWLWRGKQTVCPQPKHSLALARKGQTHYVSTYTGESWMQKDCKAHEIEKIKAEHMAQLKREDAS